MSNQHTIRFAEILKIEKVKNFKKVNRVGKLFMDPSKALDTSNHSLLITKLNTYKFS